MHNSILRFTEPVNEPVRSYAPGTTDRVALKQALADLESSTLEIPVIVGGKEIYTGDIGTCVEPHNHAHVLARYHRAGAHEVQQAIIAAAQAKREWESMPYEMRAAVFFRAAELLSNDYRFIMNAATMLNQSKNPYQAEIDCVCELADFWRFNAYYMQQLYAQQPNHSPKGIMNFIEYRSLEGFVYAITPFNFTSIAGNLPTAPALMGNVVLWKPASAAVFSGYYIMKILEKAGLPAGVINFLPGRGAEITDTVLASPEFSALHFTGSTRVFGSLWKKIGENLSVYRSYPRIVGETGGKDFLVAHSSADLTTLRTAMIRGAFEYQGQKCSALSRAYIPASIWKELKPLLLASTADISVGDIHDFSCFMNAVIDETAFDKTMAYFERARNASDATILCGGTGNKEKGYFITPTIIQAHDPHYETMVEELFAPVLSIYVYPDEEYKNVLALCDETSTYGLTGSIFAEDRHAILHAYETLRHAAGNFYINDKPTGAVVGQQPFGGARGSGTNDKAGSVYNLLRWTSPRTVKESFLPAKTVSYPFMQ